MLKLGWRQDKTRRRHVYFIRPSRIWNHDMLALCASWPTCNTAMCKA